MIQFIKNSLRTKSTLYLFCMTMFCFMLSTMRLLRTDKVTLLFLNWNLFLAFLPWLITKWINYKKIRNKILFALMIISWILLFPNSPYILTDLFHLKIRASVPLWYDLIVILAYAWTGLMFGFVSLQYILKLLGEKIERKYVDIIAILFLFISAFGVYLGRYMRWNSWDIISNPFDIFHDVLDRFANPTDHGRTWGVTLLFGVFLNMIFFSIRMINEENIDKKM
jgi:uncharacterized membrane protein